MCLGGERWRQRAELAIAINQPLESGNVINIPTEGPFGHLLSLNVSCSFV